MWESRQKKKGVIFSLDAILSLVAAVTIITASFFYLSQIQVIKWSQPNRFITTLDTLNVLRIDGSFNRVILGTNTTNEIQEFLDNMYESNQCGSIEIYNASNDVRIIQQNKTGCSSYGALTISRKSIYVDDTIYYVVLRFWYE